MMTRSFSLQHFTVPGYVSREAKHSWMSFNFSEREEKQQRVRKLSHQTKKRAVRALRDTELKVTSARLR